MIAEYFMNFGTLLLVIAAIPNIPSIWRNRHDLKGYSLSGAIIMFTGLSGICVAFFMIKMWFSMLTQILPIVMWGMVVLFKWRNNSG